MKVLPCGDTALLIDCASLTEAQSWYAALDGRVDIVLGARTVLIHGDPIELRALIARTTPALTPTGNSIEPIEIPVTYDGADLAEVAALTRLTEAEVVMAHTDTLWTTAFGGFAPGFSYLSGGDPRLQVPRRRSPRTRVPAGAVGLAGEFSGIYPRESPGGWQLIGNTATPLWDLERTPPALLLPGQLVRFTVVS